MTRKSSRILSMGLASLLSLPAGIAGATDGYFLHGLGAKAKALGGAGMAFPEEAMAIATNPATATELGHRLDVGIDLFMPDRDATISGSFVGLDGHYDGNRSDLFVMGDIAYVRPVSERVSVGIAAYANGGMNTHYRDHPFAAIGATGEAESDLKQGFVVPTIAYRIAEGHSIGLSAVGIVQSFRLKGMDVFSVYSVDPGNFTDRGDDISVGGGFRIGYFGRLNDRLSVGANYQSKLQTTSFDKYSGLFADGGAFDVPASWGGGAAFRVTDRLTLVGDLKRIEYSDVPALGNSLSLLAEGVLFGVEGGPGFGWRDITAYKIGAVYAASDRLTLRAGYGYSENPVRASETLLNTFAPAVVQDHYTIGATWQKRSNLEVTGYAMYAPRKRLEGRGSIVPAFGGGENDVTLEETSVGLSLGVRF